MTMTPEERAVVQAAIDDHRGCAPEACGGSRLDPCGLANAIERLINSCPECNSGGHTCPGDGNSIGHGDVDCGRHEVCICPRNAKQYCASVDCHGGEWLEPGWVPRTWLDVRTGDHVRMGENQAYVQSAVRLHWHVKPGTGTSAYNPPVPLDWACVKVALRSSVEGMPGNHLGEWDMDPAKPIDIELSPSEVAAIEAIGWAERDGLVVSRLNDSTTR